MELLSALGRSIISSITAVWFVWRTKSSFVAFYFTIPGQDLLKGSCWWAWNTYCLGESFPPDLQRNKAASEVTNRQAAAIVVLGSFGRGKTVCSSHSIHKGATATVHGKATEVSATSRLFASSKHHLPTVIRLVGCFCCKIRRCH